MCTPKGQVNHGAESTVGAKRENSTLMEKRLDSPSDDTQLEGVLNGLKTICGNCSKLSMVLDSINPPS